MGELSPPETLASSAVKTAFDVNSPLIIVVTESGNTARLVAKYFPRMPVLALTRHAWVARQCYGYIANVNCKLLGSVDSTEDIIRSAIDEYVLKGFCSRGDPIICLYGHVTGSSGATNMMRVFTA